MDIGLLNGVVILFVFALACMGWAGYWIEFQQRIKLQDKVKQFYGEV